MPPSKDEAVRRIVKRLRELVSSRSGTSTMEPVTPAEGAPAPAPAQPARKKGAAAICIGNKKNGNPCKMPASSVDGYCHVHAGVRARQHLAEQQALDYARLASIESERERAAAAAAAEQARLDWEAAAARKAAREAMSEARKATAKAKAMRKGEGSGSTDNAASPDKDKAAAAEATKNKNKNKGKCNANAAAAAKDEDKDEDDDLMAKIAMMSLNKIG
jgi:hypothetical protein